MAIFKKKQDNGPVALERERADWLARRERLREKLAGARAALDGAIADRRKSLLESDDTGDTGSQQIMTLGIEHDAIADALEQIEAKVSHVESRLIHERSRAEREAAANELDDSVRKVVGAVEALKTSAATMVATLPGLLQLTPHSNVHFAKDLSDLFTNVNGTINETLDLAKAQIAALRSPDGDARIVRQPAPPPAPAPVPVIERVDCLLIADSAWPENGEVKSAGRWTIRGLPLAIADRAVKLGWAFLAASNTVKRLLETNQVSINGGWHSPDPRTCIDLATVAKKPPVGSFGRSLGEVDEATPATLPGGAIERVGEPIVGIATAGPV